MSKCIKVIFAKFSLVNIFLTIMDTVPVSSCCLSTAETLIEWLHDTLYIQ